MQPSFKTVWWTRFPEIYYSCFRNRFCFYTFWIKSRNF